MRTRTREPPSWPGLIPRAGYVDADWKDRIVETACRRGGPYVLGRNRCHRPEAKATAFIFACTQKCRETGILAASQAPAGRQDKAQQAMTHLRQLDPTLRLATLADWFP